MIKKKDQKRMVIFFVHMVFQVYIYTVYSYIFIYMMNYNDIPLHEFI